EQLTWEEPLYHVAISGNQSYTAKEVLVEYVSHLTPRTTFAVDLLTAKKQQLQIDPVNGDYDVNSYRQKQLWAVAEDGVKIPLTAVYHKDALSSGPAPLILDGYGSYGANSDPFFSPYRIPLLDKGVIFV